MIKNLAPTAGILNLKLLLQKANKARSAAFNTRKVVAAEKEIWKREELREILFSFAKG
jgi:hypothetical protein